MRRLKIKLVKFFNSDAKVKITKSERLVTMTALQLMRMPDTELLIHPSREKYYIHTKDDQFLIVISLYPECVTLSNHKYQYDVKFSKRAMNFLKDQFESTTETRRDNFEAKFLANTESSLQAIYNSTKSMLPYAE